LSSNTKTFSVTLLLPSGERRVVPVADNQHIWDAAWLNGVELPALCHLGWCLTCAARLEGPGEFDQSDSRIFFPQDRDAGFVLLCTARPRSDLVLHTHQAGAMRAYRRDHGLPVPYAGV
jgi:ferredoxin